MQRNEASEKLTTKQQAAIAAILRCPTLAEAAKAIGVARVTVSRWMTDSTFKRELSKAEGDLIASATRRLATLTEKAIRTLEQLLQDKDTPAPVRVRAALGVLESMVKLKSFQNLEERVSDLEGSITWLDKDEI